MEYSIIPLEVKLLILILKIRFDLLICYLINLKKIKFEIGRYISINMNKYIPGS